MAKPIPASNRIDGMTGEIYSDLGVSTGKMRFQGDVTSISGTIAQDRREVPVPGTRNTQNKGGRISRSGNFSYQKVDDAREIYFLRTIDDLDILRARRNSRNPVDAYFSMLLALDDPEAWGASRLLLTGCRMWEIPIGFNINDLVEREVPFTWENEIVPQGGSIVRPASSF
jgi:hypothetical protein